MRTHLWPIALLVVGLVGCSESSRPPSEPLARAADRALAEGKDATVNVGFARFLGLKADQPIPVKRIQLETGGVINMLNVLREDPNTIILSERRQLLATFYLTDRSGTLRRAVVNDSAIADGGITNLALAAATAGFEKHKQLWLQRKAP